jgi:hypothetical protein
MAVSIDAGTDKELTVFTATVHKDKLEEVRSLLSLKNPCPFVYLSHMT